MKPLTDIESAQNPQVKELAALCTRKGRGRSGRFLIEGVRILEDALDADNVSIHRVAVLAGLEGNKTLESLLKKSAGAGASLLRVSDTVMRKISRMETSQGIAAEVSFKTEHTLAAAEFGGATVLAHGVRDPRNMGLLARTADAAGVTALFAPAGATDPFHPLAVQTSMGAALRLNIVTDVSSAEVIEAAREKQKGIAVIGTSVRGGKPISRFTDSPPENFMLVLGNEGAGIDDDILQLLDWTVTLPMWGRTESLNVAVATGVLLYLHRLALEKQENKKKK